MSLNGTVSDIAGNTVTTNTTLPGLAKYEAKIVEESEVSAITADTTKPTISLAVKEAVDKYSDGKQLQEIQKIIKTIIEKEVL